VKAVAVVVTYGRAELGELLACVERQTHQLPTLVYVDDAPGLTIKRVASNAHVRLVHGPPQETLGAVRHNAIEAARCIFSLEADSGVLVLDDDDFYSSEHFATTLRALGDAKDGWTGGLAIGVAIDGAPVEYVCNEAGCGQHATWGFRLGKYDQAGGYPNVARDEDLALAYAMGFRTCSPHWQCTHVRRQTSHSSVSGLGYDRAKLRLQVPPQLAQVEPRWSEHCYFFERWCRMHFSFDEPTRPQRP
jgi:hypothetical protein